MGKEGFSEVTQIRQTGIVIDPRYANHCTGPGHPECPERLEVLDAMLQEPDMRESFQAISPRRIEKEELMRVHSPEYISRLAATEGRACTILDPDTQTSPLSHEAALLAAGGICRAIEQVHTGLLDNAFALVRPPGHQAERAKAGGFCLYNNVAVGVRYAQQSLGLRRILVADWDLHHGNGTQHCFEEDPSVLFFSIHRSFFYPGSGGFSEAGKGGGRGTTVNIPLLPGFGDGEYVALFEKILKPIAFEFKPDFILVSAGFDIHFKDTAGGMRVTPEGFSGMTRSIMDIADRCCGGKIVMALEGGYHLEGLKDSVKAVLRELAGLQGTDIDQLAAGADPKRLNYILWRIRGVHAKYWRNLNLPSAEATGFKPSIRDRANETLARLAAYFRS